MIAVIRIRLLSFPLERDEGEYAYAGQLMLQGIPPYQLAYNMKFPGTYAAYALVMSIFGQTIVGIHLGLLVVNAATIALVFLLGRRLVNSTAGIVAAASYAILSVSPSVLGFAAHATHFVMLPVLGGALLLLRPSHSQSKKIVFASGVLFGIGLLMKQPALFFIPFGAGYLFYRDWRARLNWKQISTRSAIFLGGAALPFAATCLVLWRAGVFEKFWFWSWTYARAYGDIVSASQGVRIFFGNITGVIGAGWALWVLAAAGVIACLCDKKLRPHAVLLLAFLFFSGLALCPGFYFREHYFVLVLPAICLLAGAAVASAENLCSRYARPLRFIPLVLFVAAWVLPLRAKAPFFFTPNPGAACRMIYGANPFPEAIRIAEYLKEHTNADDTIAVLGSEPEIYFYSHRHSATGYIYTYGLMEPHQHALPMQREMIQEIETARPKYLVVVSMNISWLKQPGSENLIFDWFAKYCPDNFALEGVVTIVSAAQTDYYLPLTSESIRVSPDSILIYKRKF
ncbi:MAG TPA: glycosyltransferase family 39 protein [Chthoniobacterales bacterium]|nr:glycosyltransferase family 39 protein [Chthoniobacterales bacterium]